MTFIEKHTLCADTTYRVRVFLFSLGADEFDRSGVTF